MHTNKVGNWSKSMIIEDIPVEVVIEFTVATKSDNSTNGKIK